MENMPIDHQLPRWGPSEDELKSTGWNVGREMFKFAKVDEEDDGESIGFSDPEEDDVDDAGLVKHMYALDVADREFEEFEET